MIDNLLDPAALPVVGDTEPPVQELDDAKRGLTTVPCECCAWPMPYGVLNSNLICPCCGYEPEYDSKMTGGVDGYRSRWNRQWWDEGTPKPLIIRALLAASPVAEGAKPQSQCPKCRQWQDDLDGFGVLKCWVCNFCAHPSIDGDTCNLCGRDVSADASPRQQEGWQHDYRAALEVLPDSLGRSLAARIQLVLDDFRRELHIGCELRRELDGGIERDATAIAAQWPDAAAYLRSHAHIEDGL